jgi:hypothetical protein
MNSGLDFRTTSDTLKTENVDDAGEASADVKGEQAPADIKNFDKVPSRASIHRTAFHLLMVLLSVF